MLNFVLTLDRRWRARKAPKLSSEYLKDNMQIQTIFELHTDDNKSKYSKDILKSAKKLRKSLHQGNFHS